MSSYKSYQLRWQRDAHRALGEFLTAAIELGLPAVSWTIATSGALVADVDSLTSTPAEMRVAFDAWVRRLDAVVTPERTSSDGGVHLYAKFAWSKDDSAGGAIRATIYPAFDDRGES